MSGDPVALLSGIFLVALGTEKSSAMSSNVNLCGGQGFMDIYLFSAPSRPWMGSRPYPSPSYWTLLLTPKGPGQPATTAVLTSGTTAPCLTLDFTVLCPE